MDSKTERALRHIESFAPRGAHDNRYHVVFEDPQAQVVIVLTIGPAKDAGDALLAGEDQLALLLNHPPSERPLERFRCVHVVGASA